MDKKLSLGGIKCLVENKPGKFYRGEMLLKGMWVGSFYRVVFEQRLSRYGEDSKSHHGKDSSCQTEK